MLFAYWLLAIILPLCSSTFIRNTDADYIAIRQTLNTYPLAIDNKDFGLLAAVFSPNAIANYSTGVGILSGLDQIESGLEAR